MNPQTTECPTRKFRGKPIKIGKVDKNHKRYSNKVRGIEGKTFKVLSAFLDNGEMTYEIFVGARKIRIPHSWTLEIPPAPNLSYCNGTCQVCGSPAYIGFKTVECCNVLCKNY